MVVQGHHSTAVISDPAVGAPASGARSSGASPNVPVVSRVLFFAAIATRFIRQIKSSLEVRPHTLWVQMGGL